MNLQEQLELAFKAGAEFMREEIEHAITDIAIIPSEIEINKAAEHYVNKEALSGNSQSI